MTGDRGTIALVWLARVLTRLVLVAHVPLFAGLVLVALGGELPMSVLGA